MLVSPYGHTHSGWQRCWHIHTPYIIPEREPLPVVIWKAISNPGDPLHISFCCHSIRIRTFYAWIGTPPFGQFHPSAEFVGWQVVNCLIQFNPLAEGTDLDRRQWKNTYIRNIHIIFKFRISKHVSIQCRTKSSEPLPSADAASKFEKDILYSLLLKSIKDVPLSSTKIRRKTTRLNHIYFN